VSNRWRLRLCLHLSGALRLILLSRPPSALTLDAWLLEASSCSQKAVQQPRGERSTACGCWKTHLHHPLRHNHTERHEPSFAAELLIHKQVRSQKTENTCLTWPVIRTEFSSFSPSMSLIRSQCSKVLEDGQDDADYHNKMRQNHCVLRNRLFPIFEHLHCGNKMYLVLDNASNHASRVETW